MADIEEFRRLLQNQQQRALAEAEEEAATERKPGGSTGSSSIFASLVLDGQTKSMLQGVVKSRDPKQTGYSNADLAEELLKSEHIKLGGPGLTGIQRGTIQRLSLVARLFGAVDSDANISPSFKHGFAALRFPLIKSSLADPGFFTQRAHPLRIVAGDLVQKAVEASASNGQQSERHLEELLANASRDFDLSAAFVRPMLAKLEPLKSEVMEQFLKQLQDEQKDRDATRQRRARDVVGKVIQSRVLTTHLPQLVQFLIHEEWAAVLAKRLLDKGAESPEYRDALGTLDQLIERVPGAESGAALPDALLKRLEEGLREAGRTQGSVILSGLRKLSAWMLTRPPDPEASPEASLSPPEEMPELVPASAPEGEDIGPTALDDILQEHAARRGKVVPPRLPMPPPSAPRGVQAEIVSRSPAPPPPIARPAPPPPPVARPAPPPPVARRAPSPPPPVVVTPPRAPELAPRVPAPPPVPAFLAPPPPVAPPPPAVPSPAAPDAKPAVPGTLPEVLGELLRAGRWFRVFEHTSQKMRWVKLEAYYPAQNSIVFAEFDGASPLGVHADRFVTDLKQGLSAPTNPDTATKALLAALVKSD